MAPLLSKQRIAGWQTVFAMLDSLPSSRRTNRPPQHLLTGRAGEEAALFYLRGLGYTITARGWHSGRAPGDLDLVGWEGETLCFVEVKTRSSKAVAAAEAAIDRDKRRSLRRLARHYLRQVPENTVSRFDVVSLYMQPGAPARRGEFALFRDAFGWNEQA